MTDLDIRSANVSDLTDIAEIYNEQVTGGISTFDIERVTAAAFAARIEPPGDNVFLSAVSAGSVVGFASSAPFRPRPAYAGTRETSVYVARDAWGRGVATALYTELLARLDALEVHTQMAVIALPNEASEALHRRFGFSRVGTLREVGRKFDRWIDTAWYQRMAPGRPTSG